jgi:hypothetical protein
MLRHKYILGVCGFYDPFNESHPGLLYANKEIVGEGNKNFQTSTVITQFMSSIPSSKTARKAKTRKMNNNFPLLPDGNNDRSVRGRSSYKRILARKLKNRH